MEKDDAYYREAELELKRRELAFKERENTFGARFIKSAAIVLPLCISLLLPFLGYAQWNTSRADAAAAAERKAALDVQKVSIYAEAIYVTGKLRRVAATPEGRNSKEYATLKAELENLYWSRLPLVEDAKVSNAMVVFSKGLRYLENPVPENLPAFAAQNPVNPARQEEAQKFLGSMAIDLALAIRHSLAQSPPVAAAAATPSP